MSGQNSDKIAILGAGTMGVGIAQLAATSGHSVVLFDLAADALEKGRGAITQIFKRAVDKGRMDDALAASTLARIEFTTQFEAIAGSSLVIEAIVEDLERKLSALRRVESTVAADAVIATNTSSLSIASLSVGLERPERFLGLHFFNPAPVMQLVEVIPGVATSQAAVDRSRALMSGWQKTPVIAKDTPGFIVNRVARPYYGESLRIHDEGIASPATIDWALRELGRFRMGPFELMDFIGHDVNFVVTRTVFESMFCDPRFKPSHTQQRLLEAGMLGRKSGLGFYDYRPGAEPPTPNEDRELGEQIFRRVLAMLINEAADAVLFGVATAGDIDQAMCLGANYPKGLLAWGDEWGLDQVVATLDGLRADYGEERYRVSALLRRLARRGAKFHAEVVS